MTPHLLLSKLSFLIRFRARREGKDQSVKKRTIDNPFSTKWFSYSRPRIL